MDQAISDATALKEQGNELYLLNKYDEAIAQYDAGRKLLSLVDITNFHSDPKVKQLQVALLSNASQCHIHMKRWDAAMTYANDALDIDKTHEKSQMRFKAASDARQEEMVKSGPKLSTMNFIPPTAQGAQHAENFGMAVELNNEGLRLSNQGRHEEALQSYQAALKIKCNLFGERSKHYIITLSGVADELYHLGRLDEAEREASRMKTIATSLKEKDQVRIADEILGDVSRARKRLKQQQPSAVKVATA